jgi:methylmalonyl-CoA/ethylmalonyl-CoA epimerase
MTVTQDMKLHHFGILVEDIEACSRDFVDNFGYEIRSEIIHDPLQAAVVRFLALPAEMTYIELVAPDSPQSVLQNALKRVPGLNHICFSTSDIEESLRHMNSRGAMVIHSPVPAVAFRNKRIAWLMDPNCILVELVERGVQGELDFPSVFGSGE